MHDTGISSTLRTDRFTPLARAMLRNSSARGRCPAVTSTVRANVESRSTSASNLRSIQAKRIESASCAAQHRGKSKNNRQRYFIG